MWASLLGKSVRVVRIAAWVLATFIFAQLFVGTLYGGLLLYIPSLAAANESVVNTTFAVVGYGLGLVLAIGMPYVWKSSISKRLLGVDRAISWRDIGFSLLAAPIYLVITYTISSVVVALWPALNSYDNQDLLFELTSSRSELLLVFFTLVILAPLAEELLFRGYLQGKLQNFLRIRWAVVLSALVFGVMHIFGTELQLMVALDTFALGLVLATLRAQTGAIWSGVLLHAMKNGLAFYLLFINPSILGML